MNWQTCLRFARPFVLLLLLAGVLLFGANNAAWATPAQSGLAAPTVPTRNELLQIKNITCRQQVPVVEFDVSNLSSSVSDYGTVSYVVNGLTRSAAFDRRTGNTARYLDTIPSAQVATNSIYSVSSASVTLTSSGTAVALSLDNPSTFAARCGGPSNAPGGSGHDSDKNQPSEQPAQPCADGGPQGAVGPNINTTIANCPWIVFVTGDDIRSNGRIEIRPLAPKNLPRPNSGDTFSGPLADIVFVDASGNLVAHPTFANPIEICYAYSAADLARVGNNPAGLTIQFYDEGSATWITLPTAPNAAAGRVCATVNHLTTYAVAIHQQLPASLPNTGADDARLAMWIWLAIGVSMLAGATLLLLARRPARR